MSPEEMIESGDVEIVQLGVSLLIEQRVERSEIETLLAPTRFMILSSEDGIVIKLKVNGLYNQLKEGNWKVVNKFDKKYLIKYKN
jgi:hypothetical protein